MQVTVIGYWGAFPKVNGATSGYLLEEKGFHLLIDCGSAVVSKLQQYMEMSDLNAVILSHYHHDHVADIGPLQYAQLIYSTLKKQEKELPIYGHVLDQEGFSRLTFSPYTKGYPYREDQLLKIGPFSISFLKTKHPVPCFAMRISNGEETIVYTADSSFFPELISFSNNADLLICECSLYKWQNGRNLGHMTSSEAGKLANEANVKKLLLTHLPHIGEHQQLVEEAKEQYHGPVELAREGWIFHHND